MNIKSTHTVAELELSPAAYAEIASKLRDAGYDHCFGIGNDEGLIDMSGIGVVKAATAAETIAEIGIGDASSGPFANAQVIERTKLEGKSIVQTALEGLAHDLIVPPTPEPIRDVALGTCQVSFAKWIEIEQVFELVRKLRTDRQFVYLCALRGSIALDANDALHIAGTSSKELESLRLLEKNVLHLLEDSKHAIRVREGGGPEDVALSLAVTFVKLESKLAKLLDQINSPMTANYLEAVKNEALHQRERWGVDHDEGKSDVDWLFLAGYLGGKAVEAGKIHEHPQIFGESEEISAARRLHHIVAMGAAVLNWHEARSGGDTRMRPGIGPAAKLAQDAFGSSGVAELREPADGIDLRRGLTSEAELRKSGEL